MVVNHSTEKTKFICPNADLCMVPTANPLESAWIQLNSGGSLNGQFRRGPLERDNYKSQTLQNLIVKYLHICKLLKRISAIFGTEKNYQEGYSTSARYSFSVILQIFQQKNLSNEFMILLE
jgi:hypothetical protein